MLTINEQYIFFVLFLACLFLSSPPFLSLCVFLSCVEKIGSRVDVSDIHSRDVLFEFRAGHLLL
jgi:hypothetical protein